MDLGKEFKKFALKDQSISSLNLHRFEQLQNNMTPYVLEERDLGRIHQIDVFSRMMKDRIIWIVGEVNEHMATIFNAQLLFLDNISDSEDIMVYINSPGGEVYNGLSMVDVMEYVGSDVVTINTGMCASMASVLLAAGTKGKRTSLPTARVMMHQSSGGFSGVIHDAKVSYQEWVRLNDSLFEKLSNYTGKTIEQIKDDTQRDYWLSAKEAEEYGIIDSVLKSRKK